MIRSQCWLLFAKHAAAFAVLPVRRGVPVTTSPAPYRVLMVCTGNICRSAMAHQVLQQKIRELSGTPDQVDIVVDSCGVSDEEHGNPIDRRAARVLRENGYNVLPHRARQIRANELGEWDLILAMTGTHLSRLNRLADLADIDVSPGAPVGDPHSTDIRLFREFDPQSGPRNMDVPDPWYGDYSDFVDTLGVIERSIPAILEHARASE